MTLDAIQVTLAEFRDATAHRVFDEVLHLAGTGTAPAVVELHGPRVSVTAVPVANVARGTDAAGWSADLPLAAARWGGALLPLPSGTYRLHAGEASISSPAIGLTMLDGLRAELDADGTVRIGPAINPVYESGEGQDALESRYVMQRGNLENAVFFESFYGRNASCNPLAIDRELARVAPHVTRYWSVIDLSVQVPEGAIAVVEGSPDWWRARGASRLLVVNDWLRRRYHQRHGQRVLQTWHGTPLKRLALHRPGFDPRRAIAVWRESRRWDALLAQNEYSAAILRRAYAFLPVFALKSRPVWIEGYPRNDALLIDDGARAETRALLGIPDGARVVLYAPTWRDDRTEIVEFAGARELAADLGDDVVVLVRGHSRTLLPGRDAEGTRVIDVTGFPDTTRLLLAADALVTDYSSVMFDFSATGKPMYFLVPDIEHYRGELRGFYFDLEAHAPGPVARTRDELLAALRSDTTEVYAERYAERYAHWQAKFNAHDDGHASRRVVKRLFAAGFIDANPRGSETGA